MRLASHALDGVVATRLNRAACTASCAARRSCAGAAGCTGERIRDSAWASTNTAGSDNVLGIAVRKHGSQARALLRRGQTNAVQARLDTAPASTRSRLDLVFMIDATGSMSDEIAKLEASMRRIAPQIAELPARPELCFGLVAYRDRGDAFLTPQPRLHRPAGGQADGRGDGAARAQLSETTRVVLGGDAPAPPVTSGPLVQYQTSTLKLYK